MSLLLPQRYCPLCYGRDIHRSRRRGAVEKAILPFLLLHPFRCKECDSRYFDLSFAVRMNVPQKQIYGSLVDF
jgi:hypothetical protein